MSTAAEKEFIRLCDNIKKLMEKYSLTREELAKIAGVTPECISAFEEYFVPSCFGIDNLLTVCRYFKITPKDLFK